MSDNNYEPPPLEPTLGDAAHIVARAGLSAIPGIGGPATELLNAVFLPPLLRRQQCWRQDVAQAIRRLEARNNLSPEALSQNEEFLDTVLHATHVALRTSQEEKLRALRAAVENSPIDEAPEAPMQHGFVNLVDQFTVWHIRLLRLFDDPREWFSQAGRKPQERALVCSLSDVLEEAFPELKEQREFYDQVWRDLFARGLVNTDQLHTMGTPTGCFAPRTTPLGQKFLKFITEPRITDCT